MSICESLNALSINKIIIRNININELEDKFIFVGYRELNIINILNKLEAKQTLNNADATQLDKAIPSFNKKVGNLKDYNIYFIYHYLEENFNINHASIIIYEAIKNKIGNKLHNNIYNLHPHNILLYKYSKNIDYIK